MKRHVKTSSKVIKEFWKVKIERVNCKDNSLKLPLDTNEEDYKPVLELEANKLIKVISTTSKSEVNGIRVLFVIHKNEGNIIYSNRFM